MRRYARLAVFLMALPAVLGAQQARARPPVTVALYPFTVADTTQASLRALGDSCVGVMARRLSAESILVLRQPPPIAQVRVAKSAQYAITSTIKAAKGKYDVELKLWDVPLDRELRSYFSGPDSLACRVPAAAATRIGTVIREMERAKRRERRS